MRNTIISLAGMGILFAGIGIGMNITNRLEKKVNISKIIIPAKQTNPIEENVDFCFELDVDYKLKIFKPKYVANFEFYDNNEGHIIRFKYDGKECVYAFKKEGDLTRWNVSEICR